MNSMKSLLILSEMRNGSTWVGSLTNSTERLGVAKEWLHAEKLDKYGPAPADGHFEHVLSRSSTDNGVFAAKIFPSHLHDARERFLYDFIETCIARYETQIVLLERLDRVGAAISAARAFHTGQWAVPTNGSGVTDKNAQSGQYDRQAILKHMAHIGESIAFWKNYLSIRGLPYIPVFYEDIIQNPRAYVERVASAMGVDVDLDRMVSSLFQIQRDEISVEWRRRFLEEGKGLQSQALYDRGPVYPRTVRNLFKFLTKKTLLQSGKASEFRQ
jgi:LPS sulfotransferase NodH